MFSGLNYDDDSTQTKVIVSHGTAIEGLPKLGNGVDGVVKCLSIEDMKFESVRPSPVFAIVDGHRYVYMLGGTSTGNG